MGDLLPLRQRAGLVQNDGQHAIQIVPNVCIGKPQNDKALMSEIEIPVPVTIDVVRVSVNFDDQSDQRAEEVADIGFDDGLPAKLEAAEPRDTQMVPDARFIFAWLAAIVAGELA